MEQEALARTPATQILIDGEPISDVVALLRARISNIEKNELLSSSKLPNWMTQCFSDIISSADSVLECQSMKHQFKYLETEAARLKDDLLLLQSNSIKDSLTISDSQSQACTKSAEGGTPQYDFVSSSMAKEMIEANDMKKLLGEMLKPIWHAVSRQSDDFMALRDTFSDAKETVVRLQAELGRRDALAQARTSKSEHIVQSNIERIEEILQFNATRDDLTHLESKIAKQMGINRQALIENIANRWNMLDERFLVSCEAQENVNSSQAEKTHELVKKLSIADNMLRQSLQQQSTTEQQHEKQSTLIADLTDKLHRANDERNQMRQSIQSLSENQKSSKEVNDTITEELVMHEMQLKSVEQDFLDAINRHSDIAQTELRRVENQLNEVLDQNLAGELQTLKVVVDLHIGSIQDCSVKIESAQMQIDENEKSQQSRCLDIANSIINLQESTVKLTEDAKRVAEILIKNSDDATALASDISRLRAEFVDKVDMLHKRANEVSLMVDQSVKSSEFELTAARQQLFRVEDFNANLRSTLKAFETGTDEKFQLQRQENQVLQDSISKIRTSHIQLCKQQEQFDSRITSFQTESRCTIEISIAELTKQLKKESERVEAFYYSYQSKQEEFADIVVRSSIRNMTLADLKRELDRVCEIFVSECWKFEISGRSAHQSITASDNINASNSHESTRKLFNERQQQLLVQNSQFFADLIVARAEFEALRAGCNKEVVAQSDLSGRILSKQAAMAEKLKAKVRFKIVHNKNTGEQFDANALNRRELFITTLLNLLDASVQRRTLFGASNNNLQLREQDLEYRSKTDETSTELAEARQQSQSSNLGEEVEPNNRSISNYVYRGGFRIPKASGSMQRATLHDKGPNDKSFSADLNGENCAASGLLKPFEGWVTTEYNTKSDEALLAKSCSLPVLNSS
uniref:AlNc14C256G9732 protein n=1 Tax=Albugo laibachii Nc14 TaxID=890382 RepID=F0WTQ8_9STRA|nr:AlNc14C256G9732 [Albugo laibachii Nc14]|eukprot:CCA24750.1 AlNc14C256G9732 [Albugo laibachii Nc14]